MVCEHALDQLGGKRLAQALEPRSETLDARRSPYRNSVATTVDDMTARSENDNS
jgi:hypothetical protein